MTRVHLLRAAIAAAALLVGAADGRAGYSLILSSSDVGVQSAKVDDNSFVDKTRTDVGLTGPGTIRYRDSLDQPDETNIINVTSLIDGTSNKGYNGVSFSISSQTNLPGEEVGRILTTSLDIRNTTNTARNIQFTFLAEPFTAPGAGGSDLYAQTRLAAFSGLFVPGSSIDAYTRVVDADEDVRTGNFANSVYAANPFVEAWSNQVRFIRGSDYSLMTVINLTLAAGQSVTLKVESTVVTPAPQGLWLVLSAIPALAACGYYSRRFGAAPAAAAA